MPTAQDEFSCVPVLLVIEFSQKKELVPMKRIIAMMAVMVLVGVWTAQAEDEVKAVAPAPAVASVQEMSHCLAINGGMAAYCACSNGCTCALSTDGKNCTCGKAVKECPMAGKFCCEKCLRVSDKPGACPKCGAAMKAMPAKAADVPKAE